MRSPGSFPLGMQRRRHFGDHGRDHDAIQSCTEWVNSMLQAIGEPPVDDIFESFKDGLVLAKLLEACFGKPVHVSQRTHIMAVKLDNIAACMRAIERELGHVTRITGKEFFDGDEKHITSFISRLKGEFPEAPPSAPDGTEAENTAENPLRPQTVQAANPSPAQSGVPATHPVEANGHDEHALVHLASNDSELEVARSMEANIQHVATEVLRDQHQVQVAEVVSAHVVDEEHEAELKHTLNKDRWRAAGYVTLLAAAVSIRRKRRVESEQEEAAAAAAATAAAEEESKQEAAAAAAAAALDRDAHAWRQAVDAHGRAYYYNILTKESSWHCPAGFRQSQVEADTNPEIHTFSCGKCKSLLRFPPGAKAVECGVCGTAMGYCSCSHCVALLSFPLGTRLIKCGSCGAKINVSHFFKR